MDKLEGILKLLEELFLSKGKILTDDMAKVWLKRLAHYEPKKIVYAIEMEIASKNNFPTLGNVINNIEPVYTVEEKSLFQWEFILDEVRQGRYNLLEENVRNFLEKNNIGFSEIYYADKYGITEIKKTFVRLMSDEKRVEEQNKIGTKLI